MANEEATMLDDDFINETNGSVHTEIGDLVSRLNTADESDTFQSEYLESRQTEDNTSQKDSIEKDSGNVSHDLRLVNAYFKEVGTEALLTPKEEVVLSAKIKECEYRIDEVLNSISSIIELCPDEDIERVLEELNTLIETGPAFRDDLDKSSFDSLKRLRALLDAYYRSSTQLKSRFIKSNLRLVASMAKKYVGRGVPFLDLIQEGNLGLIKAVDRFDHTRGFRFSTYACWWINQAMTRGVFNQTRTVKIPAYVLEKAGKVWTERAKFVEKYGREPQAREISKKVNMSLENVKQVLESRNGNNMVCLDSPVWKGEKTTFMDFMEDSVTSPVDSLIDEVSIPKSVRSALCILDEKEREIVKMRFGIETDTSCTLDEIGRKFGLTRERIRQIEKKALRKIRESEAAPVLRSLMDVCNN